MHGNNLFGCLRISLRENFHKGCFLKFTFPAFSKASKAPHLHNQPDLKPEVGVHGPFQPEAFKGELFKNINHEVQVITMHVKIRANSVCRISPAQQEALDTGILDFVPFHMLHYNMILLNSITAPSSSIRSESSKCPPISA